MWEDFGYFEHKHVHKGYAITFKTPIYSDPIEVQLKYFTTWQTDLFLLQIIHYLKMGN